MNTWHEFKQPKLITTALQKDQNYKTVKIKAIISFTVILFVIYLFYFTSRKHVKTIAVVEQKQEIPNFEVKKAADEIVKPVVKQDVVKQDVPPAIKEQAQNKLPRIKQNNEFSEIFAKLITIGESFNAPPLRATLNREAALLELQKLDGMKVVVNFPIISNGILDKPYIRLGQIRQGNVVVMINGGKYPGQQAWFMAGEHVPNDVFLAIEDKSEVKVSGVLILAEHNFTIYAFICKPVILQ